MIIPFIGFGQGRCVSGDCEDGYGTYIFTSGISKGDIYVGENKNGEFHGQGTYTWGPEGEWSGSYFVGEYKNGVRDGYGVYTVSNGDQFIGEYKNDAMNGIGVVKFSDGSGFISYFSNDEPTEMICEF